MTEPVERPRRARAPAGDAQGLLESSGEAPTTAAAAPAPESLARNLRSTQRAPGPAGQLLADVPHRVVALLIDMIIVGLVGLLVVSTVGSALGGVVTPRTLESSGGDLDLVPFLVVLVLVLLLSAAYFAIAWSRWRATLGMRLLGLTLLADDGGHRLSPTQALVRWVVVGIPATIATLPVFVPTLIAVLLAIVALIVLVGLLLTIGQDPARQGLHDRYAGSIVTTVSRRRLSSSP